MIQRLSGLWTAAPVAFWLLSAACLYYVVMAVRLSVIDLRSHLLPNRIVLPSYVVAGVLLISAAAAAAMSGADPALGAAWAGVPGLGIPAGGVGLWLAYFVLHLIHPPGMGFGDVKLAGVLGMYLGCLGWPHVLAGTFAAFLLGGVWSVGILALGRGTLRTAIPFGPFMLIGAGAAMVLLPA
ncbi:A24 family peptidase [Paenarthrobacter ilicis]|uniref:A24 family peptidase n=1 Tax=Paenarthrobacter ilicis TaxID=43665 RepID=UPI0028D885E4|nr:A24 family peptidase [Paenarthrobacter ilicis]